LVYICRNTTVCLGRGFYSACTCDYTEFPYSIVRENREFFSNTSKSGWWCFACGGSVRASRADGVNEAILDHLLFFAALSWSCLDWIVCTGCCRPRDLNPAVPTRHRPVTHRGEACAAYRSRFLVCSSCNWLGVGPAPECHRWLPVLPT
jgi:hypothetical protein